MVALCASAVRCAHVGAPAREVVELHARAPAKEARTRPTPRAAFCIGAPIIADGTPNARPLSSGRPEDRRQPVPVVERQPVHEPGHRDVDQEALVDALRLHAERAERDAGDDGAVHLEVRLAEVDHAVGHGHREDGPRAEAPSSAPSQNPRKNISSAKNCAKYIASQQEEVEPAARSVSVERVVAAEVGLAAHDEHRREHERRGTGGRSTRA